MTFIPVIIATAVTIIVIYFALTTFRWLVGLDDLMADEVTYPEAMVKIGWFLGISLVVIALLFGIFALLWFLWTWAF